MDEGGEDLAAGAQERTTHRIIKKTEHPPCVTHCIFKEKLLQWRGLTRSLSTTI